MSTSKSIATILTVFVCATALTIDAAAQGRGGGGHGGGSGGGRAPAAGHPASQGMSAPRTGGPAGSATYHGNGPYPVYGNGRYPYYGYGRYPYYGYGRYPYYGYPYYGYGYPYYGYPGFSVGFSWGYGYPAYAAPYDAPYGYVAPGAVATYGGIRITGATQNAEVYLDGSYAGIVDDYDGTFQRLDLEPGAHEIEIRGGAGRPLSYDVNVTPGQTITLHANANGK